MSYLEIGSYAYIAILPLMEDLNESSNYELGSSDA